MSSEDVIIKTEEAKKNSIKELLKKLSSSETGLSTLEAEQRLSQYGPNEIPEKKVNPILKFLSYFWGPIPWMIEAAIILSAIIQHWEDFWIIFALLMLNAVVGFWQEHKADNAIELLKKKLAQSARVLRDGKYIKKSAKELVPGDVVRVRLGDIVPADVKLMDGDYLLTDESALTGESMPVEKHTSDIAYSGSIIRQGEMTALVAVTGTNTYFGETTKLVEEAKTQSHFQKAVIKIGDYLIALALGLVMIIFVVSLFRQQSILQTLQFALVLTVAGIPVALPAVLSVTLAIGAISLAKKEAIVSKLVAIEEIAGMDILCSDKTGTITKNEISVAEVKFLTGFTENDVILFGTLASREENQDPIDDAIISKIKTMDAINESLTDYKVTVFKPFDPVAKRTEAAIETADGSHFKVSKGAPQVILALSLYEEAISNEVNKTVNAFAAKGYRALAVAKTIGDQDNWQFVGLFALYDPPREDSAETIKIAQTMGVNVKMITGDHTAVAKEIAHQVNLGTNIMPSSSFLNKSDREATRIIENADGFAEVFPEHKYHIVELLQNKDHIVGMTGDGVNDAPALKKADAGIAVAGATDAAKSAADIVLTKPGLSVIIDTVKESRKIFQRMNNYSIYRMTETIRVLFFITLAILVFRFYPITAIMIVLLALLNDAPIMTIAYDNVKYSDKPETWNMRTVLGIATVLGIIGVAVSFGILYIGLEILHLSHEVLQSFIYLKLSVAGHLTVFVARTKGHFWSVKPAKQVVLAVLLTQFIATLITVYGILLPAMGWALALFIWGYALVFFVITDFIKVQVYKLLDHGEIKFTR
ncbi:plasma-membrane proton-efflux P-type ATPase [Candidatus Borrarchaeum sp.]|uniref:plasma-membrane proton-efflux P-type ATPase n=1 Tax=Candidatus Borrarchaeum sp. TaxID=2846742 RepID=UPI002580C4CA|nr:plasma-membrane proton-efflux P-type ATPase [Candidatus Borrarchaeum sp.]